MFFLKNIVLVKRDDCWQDWLKSATKTSSGTKTVVSLETNRLVFLPSCQTVTYPAWRPWKATIWIRDLSEARCCEGFRGKGWQRIWSDQRYAAMLGGGHGWLCSHSGSRTNHLSCGMWQCTIASLTRVKWCRWWCKSPHHWDQRNQMQRVVTRPDLPTYIYHKNSTKSRYMYNNSLIMGIRYKYRHL